MRKTKKPVVVKYLGFEGTGATRKEAKQDAERQIAALSEGFWGPTIYSWLGESVMVYRTILAYQYGFIQHDGGQPNMGGFTVLPNETHEGAVRSAKRHLVDIAWRIGMPLDLFPAWFDNDEDRKEIIWRREWQLRYQALHDAGYTDVEAHRLSFDKAGTSAALLTAEKTA